MDFFEQQHIARKRTGRLVILFILAVLAIIALVYVTLLLVALWAMGSDPQNPVSVGELMREPALSVGVPVIVTALIGIASLMKLIDLRAGGRAIAESLGGRLLAPDTRDPTERKILNVVEEMAIASGVPVPPVYLLDQEQAINAFAAGYTPSDAVIGVTRGCVELLDRDELQGVMAHEFSHILNGDMRLNIRLIGVIFGILVLGMAGRMVLRSMFYSSAGRSRRRGGGDGRGVAIAIVVGLALIVIGALGVFFANLIKAAVSRQREFLADASAVQFTRNPDGIAGALKKIGGVPSGSRLLHPKAEEASHMYFEEGVGHWLGGLMATHPPLAERIRRIDPAWDGKFPQVEPTQRVRQRREKLMRLHEQGVAAQRRRAAQTALAGGAVLAAAAVIGRVGNPTPQHVEHARKLLGALDDRIREAARQPYGARALVYALLLDADESVRRRQVELLQERADARVAALTRQLLGVVRGMDPAARLPVIDMTLAALRELSQSQYEQFRANLDALIAADERIDLFEWVLRRIVERHLDPHFGRGCRTIVQYYNLRGVQGACATLLSVLAYAGHRDRETGLRAFRAGAAAMGLADLEPLPPDRSSLSRLGEALDRLNQVAPRVKRNVIAGAATCIAADREATIEEVELLRAICDTLDCPMPPLLPGQALT